MQDEVDISGTQGPMSPPGSSWGEGGAPKGDASGLSLPPPPSYCRLETSFSVYVYGAFPMSVIPQESTVFLLTGAILLTVWLAYFLPKLLSTEKGLRLKGFWVRLYGRCRQSCACWQGRR